MAFSDEERQRRSKRAKELVASGKIGGPRPGAGRPRKKRASEFVAEQAREEAQLIVDAYKSALQEGKPDSIRLQAANAWLAVEHKEAELELKEQKELEDMPRDQLVATIVAGLQKANTAGIIDLPESAIQELNGHDGL